MELDRVRSLNPPSRRKALNLWNIDFSTSILHTNHGILYHFQLQHSIKQIQLIMNTEKKVSWTILGQMCAERCFREFVKLNNWTKMHNEAFFYFNFLLPEALWSSSAPTAMPQLTISWPPSRSSSTRTSAGPSGPYDQCQRAYEGSEGVWGVLTGCHCYWKWQSFLAGC